MIGRAIIRDLFGREDTAKVMAYVAMAMGLAPAFAPILGGYLEQIFDWRGSFMVIAVFAAIMLAVSWRFLEETNKWSAQNAVGGLPAQHGARLRQVAAFARVYGATSLPARLSSAASSLSWPARRLS